jgi:hypothetical protein
LRFAGGFDGEFDDVFGRRMQGRDRLADRRIDHRKRLAALVVDEAAVDVVRCLGLGFHRKLLGAVLPV